MEQRRDYREGRDLLLAVLSRLGALAEERGSVGVAAAAGELMGKLEAERFLVVVVGEFKRGKSTFVNAFLGEAVLPAAVVPLTSVVTTVTWGPTPDAVLEFLDARSERVHVSELDRYVTERGNPENRLHVRRAAVRYPAPALRDGVFLVDTPGVGSVYRHNTDAAYAFIGEADAAVFLTTVDPPISETEVRFLHDVRQEAAKIFFVLNKVDYLSAEERQEAIRFTCDVVSRALGREVEVFPMSARDALRAKEAGDEVGLEASGFAAFERRFQAFLLEQKGLAILASVSADCAKLVTDELNSLDVEEAALAAPLERLGALRTEMERLFGRAERARADLGVLLRAEFDRVVAAVDEHLEVLVAGETERLLAAARRFIEEHDRPGSAAEDLDRLVKDELRAAVERWRAGEERWVADEVRRAADRFVDETNELIERTIRACGEVLGVTLSSAGSVSGLAAPTRFTYSFFEVPTLLESLLPNVRRYIPARVARRLLAREVAEWVPVLVDKHRGRLRWDFLQRLDRTRIGLERSLGERVDATVASLRLGLERAAQERERAGRESEAVRPSMAPARRRLEGLRGEVEGLLGRVRAQLEEGSHVRSR